MTRSHSVRQDGMTGESSGPMTLGILYGSVQIIISYV